MQQHSETIVQFGHLVAGGNVTRRDLRYGLLCGAILGALSVWAVFPAFRLLVWLLGSVGIWLQFAVLPLYGWLLGPLIRRADHPWIGGVIALVMTVIFWYMQANWLGFYVAVTPSMGFLNISAETRTWIDGFVRALSAALLIPGYASRPPATPALAQ